MGIYDGDNIIVIKVLAFSTQIRTLVASVTLTSVWPSTNHVTISKGVYLRYRVNQWNTTIVKTVEAVYDTDIQVGEGGLSSNEV